MIKQNNKYGCFIPPILLTTSSKILNDTDKILLSKIIILSKNEGYCFALNHYLAEQLGKSDQQISRGAKALEEKGYIIRNTIRNDKGQVRERQITLTEKANSLLIIIDEKQPINSDDTTPINSYNNPPIKNDGYSYKQNIEETKEREERYSFKEFCDSHEVDHATKEMVDEYIDTYMCYLPKIHPTLAESQWITVIKKTKTFVTKNEIQPREWSGVILNHFSCNYPIDQFNIFYTLDKNKLGASLYARNKNH